jgi:hypothetical protein
MIELRRVCVRALARNSAFISNIRKIWYFLELYGIQITDSRT